MPFPSLEKSLNKVSNRYLLVVLAAKRARQLNRGARPRSRSNKKPTSIALEEVAEGGGSPEGRREQGLTPTRRSGEG